MIRHWPQAILAVLILITAKSGHCDHVLLRDGRVLYNVMVPTGITTGTQLVRIRTGTLSFGYDPRTDTVYKLPQHSVLGRVMDVETTSTMAGRAKATQLVQKRRWNRYIPVDTGPPLVAPPPAPKATATPYYAGAAKTPVPINVISDSIPLDERLDQQLELFMSEQKKLVQDSTTSMIQGLIVEPQARQKKVELLNRQKTILEQFYPQAENTVKLAVDYWKEQAERAKQTGRFDLENL